MRRLVDAWNKYWFKSSGASSISIFRIGFAASLLLCQHTFVLPDYRLFFSFYDPKLYQPVGLVSLWPSIPSSEFCQILAIVASVSAWLLLFGFLSRINLVLSLFSSLVLHDVAAAFGGATVAFHMVFISGFALLGSDCGVRYSVDSWIRKKFANRAEPQVSNWPVLLAQLGLTLVFFNAFWFKLKVDHFHFGWVLSDNLRNILIWRFFGWSEPPTVFAAWIMDGEWRFHLAALLSMICQSLGVVACFFSTKPVLRLFGGALFAAEAAGLAFVMGFPCLHWLPLLVVFVDWDYFLRGTQVDVWPSLKNRFAVSLYTVGFLGLFTYAAFYKQTAQFYPFRVSSPFGFILAKEPLSEHQNYEYLNGRFRIDGAIPEDSHFNNWLLYRFQGLSFENNLGAVRSSLGAVQAAALYDNAALLWEIAGMPRWWNWSVPERLRVRRAWDLAKGDAQISHDSHELSFFKVLYRIPAYPVSPSLDVLGEWPVALIRKDGKFQGLTTSFGVDARGRKFVAVDSEGFAEPKFTFLERPIQGAEDRAVLGIWEGHRFFPDSLNSKSLLLVRVEDSSLEKPVVFAGSQAP